MAGGWGFLLSGSVKPLMVRSLFLLGVYTFTCYKHVTATEWLLLIPQESAQDLAFPGHSTGCRSPSTVPLWPCAPSPHYLSLVQFVDMLIFSSEPWTTWGEGCIVPFSIQWLKSLILTHLVEWITWRCLPAPPVFVLLSWHTHLAQIMGLTTGELMYQALNRTK